MRNPWCLLVVLSACLVVDAEPEWPIYDVPKVAGIVVDGSDGDWNGAGLHIPLHATRDGYAPPAGDLRASITIAWNPDGLFALATVKDNVAFEHWNPASIWAHDSVELFLSATPGDRKIYQLIVAPGIMKEDSELLRTDHVHGVERRPVDAQARALIARTRRDDGYVLEMKLPLGNIALTPGEGVEFAMQAMVNDSDTANDRLRIQWYPGPVPHGRGGNPSALHRVRLSRDAAGRAGVSAFMKKVQGEKLLVSIYGQAQDEGHPVAIRLGGAALYEGRIESYATQGLFAEVVELPLPARGNVSRPLDVRVDGATVALFDIPSAAFQARKDLSLPFARDMLNFEYRDAKDFPPPGGVVCVGSSSMRMWRTINEDLAPLPVIHRGFGGAHIAHVLMYADRIVIPYKPSQVLVYAGENDLAAGASVQQVVNDTAAFFKAVHKALPRARIFYVSMKPSPSRHHLWPDFHRGNEAIRAQCEHADYIEYVDVSRAMLGEDGQPRPEIFSGDRLHMNAAGYALWTSIIRPRLVSEAP